METDSLQPANNKSLPEAHTGKPRKSKKRLVIGIIIFGIVVSLTTGGFFGYRYYIQKQDEKRSKEQQLQIQQSQAPAKKTATDSNQPQPNNGASNTPVRTK